MTTRVFRRLAAPALVSVFALGLLADFALAQSDYPMSPRHRRNMDTTVGTFDVDKGQTQTIVDVDEPTTYRVCWTSALGQFVVDGETYPMDRGDCMDVTGKKMQVIGPSDRHDAHGVYERLDPDAVINRRRGMN